MNNGGFASLSSTLLARKGGARPAMRSSHGANLDDLGWNDMGEDRPAAPASTPLAAAIPQPIKYQETIAEEFAAEPEVEPKPPVAKPSAVVRPIRAVSRVIRKPELAVGKIAFTLRLDAERHLRLRLATAVSNRSAQRIVLDALDAYLAAHPELDKLADQVPQRKAEGRN